MPRVALPAGLLLLATVVVYLPGLGGPFLFDDYPNIVHNPLIAMPALDWESLRNAAHANDSGPTGRPLASLSFALNYWLSGQRFDAAAFKAFNLGVHVLNALLVWLLARRLLPAVRGPGSAPGALSLALLLALLWALHPLQLTGVLYVVQRMASLAATCTLVGLLVWLAGRERLVRGRRGGVAMMLAGLLGGAGAGLLFKETAVLLPLYALVLETTLLRGERLTSRGRRVMTLFFGLLVLLPGLLVVGTLLLRPGYVLGGYAARPFGLAERLLTEGRVLVDYLGMLFAPRPGAFSLFHDDFAFSSGLLDPPQTVPALLLLGLLVLAAVLAWCRGARLLPFAVAWFFAGHLLESSVLALDLMYEHRNYLPSLGPLLACVVVAARLLDGAVVSSRLRYLLLTLLCLAPAPVTLARAATWGDTGALVASLVAKRPESPRALALAASYAQARGDTESAYGLHGRVAELEPASVEAAIGMARMAHRFELAVRAGPVAPRPAPAGPVRPGQPLLADLDYLDALHRALDEEVRRRLQAPGWANGTDSALRTLRACIEARTPECLALAEPALLWYAIVLGRVDVEGWRRAGAAADRARVLRVLGRPAQALPWAELAWTRSRVDPQVLVLKAVLEIESGRLAAAAASTASLAALEGTVGFSAAQLEALQRALAQARAASANHGAGRQARDGGRD